MINLLILGVIGPWQIAIIVIIVILLFGAKKIPELFKGIGDGIKEFKKATKEETDEKDKLEKPKKEIENE